MKTAAFAFLLLAIFASVFAQRKTYENFRIIRCFLNEEELDLFHKMASNLLVDEIGSAPEYSDLLVEHDFSAVFMDRFDCEITVANVQELIDSEKSKRVGVAAAIGTKFTSDEDPYHQEYHTIEEIHAKVQEIVSQHPDVAHLSSMGESLEGRDMPVVYLNPGNSTNKKVVYLEFGIHAREWISAAVGIYILQTLSEKYGNDPKVTELMDQVEFVIAPHVNPDGYSFSWTDDRMWRKNRNPNSGGCAGVDLNRNFDVYWSDRSSSNQCAQDYHGSSAASEPEVANIQNLLTSLGNGNRIIGAVDVHSYGQYIMRPYGWSLRELHPDEDLLKELGDGMVDVIYEVDGIRYSSIRSAQLYPVSGACDDYFSVTANISAGFCFELRDTRSFILPEEQILPTGQEIYAAILYFAEYTLQNWA